MRLPGSQNSNAQTKQVDVVNDGEELDTFGAEALSTLKISVRMLGQEPVPARLAIGLRVPHGMPKAWGAVDAKGEVRLPQIPAGRYEFVIGNSGMPLSIARVSSNDLNISGHLLNLPAGANASAVLTLVSGLGTIEGFVKNVGQPVAGAMVLLVPKDSGSTVDVFRRDQSDLDGSFRLHSVAPGAYTIVAIRDGWDLDWSEPTTLAPYMAKGQQVEIRDKQNISLPESIEAQAK